MFLKNMLNLTACARGSIAAKVILGISALCVMIAFIISTVVVTSGKQPSSKNFYLVSFEYDSPGNNSATKAVSTFIGAVDKLLDSDKNETSSFNSVRVGFSGVCVHISSSDNKAESWSCGNVEATNKLGEDANGDPFDLIEIAAFYKDKIAFALPWWIASASLGLSMVLIFVASIPFITIPPIVTRIACTLSVLGSLSLLGGLVLMHVTTNAVVTLATRLTMKTVKAHPGTANQAFGWAAFALAAIATLCIGLYTAAEYACIKADRYRDQIIDKASEKALNRAPSSVRSGVSALSSSPSAGFTSKGGITGRTLAGHAKSVAEVAIPAVAQYTRGERLTNLAYRADSKKGGDNMV